MTDADRTLAVSRPQAMVLVVVVDV